MPINGSMTQTLPTQETDSLPTQPEDLLALFDQLGLGYELHHHEPVFTVAESAHLDETIPGIHCRNLFLRDKKKNMYLIIAANETAIDLKKLPELIGAGRLSFGSSERLWTHLGVRPGSVCPFAVINDSSHHIQVILDKSMMEGALVNYHPLVNHMTVSLSPDDLMRFFAHTGHDAQIVDLSPAAPDAV